MLTCCMENSLSSELWLWHNSICMSEIACCKEPVLPELQRGCLTYPHYSCVPNGAVVKLGDTDFGDGTIASSYNIYCEFCPSSLTLGRSNPYSLAFLPSSLTVSGNITSFFFPFLLLVCNSHFAFLSMGALFLT